MQTPLNMNAMRWIGYGVWLELIRRKDVYVMFMLLLVFCVGIIAARLAGVDSPAVGTFLLNLGLSLAYMLAHVLVVAQAARQMPREIADRTIYPLLARPVSRLDLILAKWLASSLCGMGAYLLFVLLVSGSVPRLESYSTMLGLQMVALGLASISLAGALAVMCSLMMPVAMAVVVVLALALVGGPLLQFIASATSGDGSTGAANWMIAYIPDFSRLSLCTRYTDGMPPIGWPMWLGLLAYACIFSAMAIYIGHLALRRRAL